MTLDGNTYVSVTVTNSLGESATDEIYMYVQATEVSARPTLTAGVRESNLGRSGETATSSVEGGDVPSHLAVTVWPNPIESDGQIELLLPEAADISIGIYDVLGRLVEPIAARGFEEGRHVLAFGRRELPAGVYIVRAVANDSIATTTLTLQ